MTTLGSVFRGTAFAQGMGAIIAPEHCKAQIASRKSRESEVGRTHTAKAVYRLDFTTEVAAVGEGIRSSPLVHVPALAHYCT